MTVHVEVKHVSASGRLDMGWEYRAADRRVDAVVRMGNVPLHLSIHVCSRERPVLGAHPIVRINGDTWRVVPERYVRVWPHRIEALAAIKCAIGDVLDPGQQLTLSASNDDTTAELEAL